MNIKSNFIGGLLAVGLTLNAQASIISDNTISGSIVNTFDDIELGVQDSLLTQTGATYGERFSGQTLSSQSISIYGDHDTLSGTPSAPLSLLAGSAGQNLFVGNTSVGHNLMGCGPDGCENYSGQGEGAVSLLLDQVTDVFGVVIGGTNGGTTDIDFFSTTGSLLDSFTVDHPSIFPTFYGFKVTSGDLIGGVSLTNLDPGGLYFNEITFNQATVPVPAAIWLFGSGLIGLVGLARRKKA